MTAQAKQELLRQLPKVDELLKMPCIDGLDAIIGYELVRDAARAAVDSAREGILADDVQTVDVEGIAQDARMRALGLMRPSLAPVINASGVVLHTNLGRSVLSEEAAQAVIDVARNYSTLEYDTASMSRGSRHSHCEQLICALTGAEAALAVNNNAAAVMMVLNEFASNRKAIVSRGEEVEIGGSFRIPDIMAQSKAQMVEVGTTNKTHLSDYEAALDDEVAMLLKVHTSNYALVGFAEAVSIKDLQRLAERENVKRSKTGAAPVVVYEDLGSGCLVHMSCFGEQAEPTVAEHVKQGADLISFSADKLLGGPQAGIIVGEKQLIERLKNNPLARAMRLDKMTLAALEATLRQYLNTDRAFEEIPTLRMLSAPASQMRTHAEQLTATVKAAFAVECFAELAVVDETSKAGGGSLPLCEIATSCLQVSFKQGTALECSRFLAQQLPTPIICRTKNEALLFDVRTLLNEEQHQAIAAGLQAYFSTLGA